MRAAELAFSTRDFDAVSMRDIARHVGISVGTIHHYFESKERLLEYSLERHYERVAALQNELLPVVLGGGSADAVIKHAVGRTFRFCWEHRNVVRMTMRSVLSTGDINERRRAHSDTPFFEALAGPLSALYEADEASMRLVIRSAMSMVVRYAISSERALRAMVQHPDATPLEETLSVIATHCGNATLAMVRAEAKTR